MELSYTFAGDGVCIDKIEQPEAAVYLPEQIEGKPVTELGAYALAGTDVAELHLPDGLKKIGAYAFYNCEKLKRISCGSRIADLGAGIFAGTKSVEVLDFHELSGEVSYLKDMLSELTQTLRVRVHGASKARLIFTEYYEESVENTPARILMIETHGCGHRYRYCFRGREFQYRDYDAIFPYAQVQEPEQLVTELALGRILYPCGLTEKHADMYRAYIKEHWKSAGELIVKANSGRSACTNLEPGLMPWFAKYYLTESVQAEAMLLAAQEEKDVELVAWLMDYRRKLCGRNVSAKTKKTRRFTL